MRRDWLLTSALVCCAAGAAHAQAPTEDRAHVDITAWRPAAPRHDALSLVQRREPDQRRAELHIPSSRGMVTELKAVGVQLDGGAKLLLRSRKGGPSVAYRNQF
jgi:hypothetical protein